MRIQVEQQQQQQQGVEGAMVQQRMALLQLGL
jgi:hypothetical protein